MHQRNTREVGRKRGRGKGKHIEDDSTSNDGQTKQRRVRKEKSRFAGDRDELTKKDIGESRMA